MHDGYTTLELDGKQVWIGGDIVVKINDTSIVSNEQFALSITALKPGDTIQVAILRNGKMQTLPVTLTEIPNQ